MTDFNWSPWHALEGAGRNRDISPDQGLYRIRRAGREALDYVGQTGMGLRRRLGMLSGVYGTVMPYNDPHTAGPAFWAIRTVDDCAFEASTCTTPGIATPERKGLECLAIAQHRQDHGRSPSFNFGRMPPGFSKSTGNNARLVTAGKRRRGSQTQEHLECHDPSIGPTGALGGPCTDAGWLGLAWGPWVPATSLDALDRGDVGLYRIRRRGAGGLLYVGEGKILDRIRAHLKKAALPGHQQAEAFADPGGIEVSFVGRPDLHRHHRLEIENDLIGAHVVEIGRVPVAQFLG